MRHRENRRAFGERNRQHCRPRHAALGGGRPPVIVTDAASHFAIRTLAVLALGLITYGFHTMGHLSANAGSGLFVFDAYAAGPGYTSPYAAGPNPLFYWATLEPEEGAYNWDALDQSLEAAASAGKMVIPRVYTNVAGFGQATPTWVFDAGAEWYYNSEFSRDNGMKQPVPTDPVFTAKFGAFLRALGARYDGDPRIEYFQTNAGMGEYGEMVWGWPSEFRPPGWTPEENLSTVKYWIDRWQEAFPNTELALMINFIGWNIMEDASAYAADSGIYLQQNSGRFVQDVVAVFQVNQGKTKIAMEIEAYARTGDGFDALIDDIFSRGYEIDYLVLHRDSFNDPETAVKLPDVQARLRSVGGNTPTATPTPNTPSTPTPTPCVAPDADGDGVCDSLDNCPVEYNPGQQNTDAAIGSGTGILGDDSTVPNGDPADSEGDACETDGDTDNDGIPDGSDPDPGGDITYDDNNDGDPCPPMGTDADDDGPSWDSDCSGVLDGVEGSCPLVTNPSGDDDGDGLLNTWEVCKWGTDPGAANSDGDALGDCVEAADVNGDGFVDFVGDTIPYAKAVLLTAGEFGKDGDFDINGDGAINFVGDVIQEAKFAIIPGLCQ